MSSMVTTRQNRNGKVAPFELRHIPEVVQLFLRVFRDGVADSASLLAHYFEELYFENPWSQEGSRGLVFERGDGRVQGFLGTLPARMKSGRTALRGLIAGSHMVDPDIESPFPAIRLLRQLFEQNQDFLVSDTANSISVRLWNQMGAVTDRIHSMGWVRLLRPLQAALGQLGKERSWRVGRTLLTPAARFPDLILSRFQARNLKSNTSGYELQELTPEAVFESAGHFWGKCRLRPDYDLKYLVWFFQQAENKQRYGHLVKSSVRDFRGKLAGWFLYYPNPGGIGQVLQIAAREGDYRAVLRSLFGDALRRGSLALIGRMDALHTRDLSSEYCFFFQREPCTVLHSGIPAVREAFLAHDCVLSRMEGEWWTRLSGKEF